MNKTAPVCDAVQKRNNKAQRRRNNDVEDHLRIGVREQVNLGISKFSEIHVFPLYVCYSSVARFKRFIPSQIFESGTRSSS